MQHSIQEIKPCCYS